MFLITFFSLSMLYFYFVSILYMIFPLPPGHMPAIRFFHRDASLVLLNIEPINERRGGYPKTMPDFKWGEARKKPLPGYDMIKPLIE